MPPEPTGTAMTWNQVRNTHHYRNASRWKKDAPAPRVFFSTSHSPPPAVK
jgi:hypothetical protein